MLELFAHSFYNFKVAAINAVGQGPFSDMSIAAATLPPEVPPPPKRVEISEVTYFSALVNWQLGVSKYNSIDNGAPLNLFVLQWDEDEDGEFGAKPEGADHPRE